MVRTNQREYLNTQAQAKRFREALAALEPEGFIRKLRRPCATDCVASSTTWRPSLASTRCVIANDRDTVSVAHPGETGDYGELPCNGNYPSAVISGSGVAN